jgi:tocopherol cyclase
MIKYFQYKLNPSWYQGRESNSQHFEGWYFKIIDKDEDNLYVIIPGIFIDRNNTDSHSFIQITDGMNDTVHYLKFPVQDFQAKADTFDIQINSNRFSADKLVLDVKNSSVEINGELNFKELTPWPKTLLNPGIMGWYTWVPFMECYHGIVSLDHEIQGSLLINKHNVNFTNGRGYTEKDWGKSFPAGWIWCQCNHFDSGRASFTGSIAIIPWIKKSFLGFIFGLWCKNRLYRFTTYTGAELVHLEIDEHRVCWVIKQKNLILEITANRSAGYFLKAPTVNGMTHNISETLKATIEIKLSSGSGHGNEIIFHETGRHGGLEIAGNMQHLLEMYKETKN